MSNSQWDLAFSLLDSGLDLEPSLVQWCMNEILTGSAEIEIIKRFLVALKSKGETSDEVGALVAQMYQHCAPISIRERAVDTVGTGGDGAHTINISLNGKGVETTFQELGIGFCFAPVFHPAMRFAAPARKELGTPTVFNILGPLANPAQPKAAAIGVANDRMHLVMAQVLGDKGVEGFVFRGDDGLDEITLATTTSVLTIRNGEISSDLIDPLDFGIDRAPISALTGGDGAENARITRAIFEGERGAPRDAVILNAAAAIAAYDGKSELNLHDRIALGVERATTAIDTGAAQELVVAWAELSQKLGA